MTINLAAPEFRKNPYAVYARYRQQEPIATVDTGYAKGAYFLTRYDDVLQVLKDPRFSSDSRKLHPDRKKPLVMRWLPNFFDALQNSMVMADDPDHRRLRDQVHKAFTPTRIQSMTSRIETLCGQLLDQAARRPEIDLIAEYALPLPLTIISEMMGVPPAQRAKFHHWTARFLESTSGIGRMMYQMPSAISMYRFLNKMVRLRSAEPQDDLITALVQAEVDHQRLSTDETLAMLFLILFAGHETTVNLIGNGTLALLEHRDQLQKLHEQPELIDSAIEELLRYGNPVEQVAPRYAMEDIEVGGRIIPKGAHVMLALGSANRDERTFENPDDLDITRSPNRHLAFGMGMHFCLGAPLARLEGQIAVHMLVQRFPQMQLAVPMDQLQWRNSVGVRGLKSLPIRLG